MKKLLITLAIFLICQNVNAQKKLEDRNPKAFVEFSPFLARFNLVAIGAGIEWDKNIIGATYTKGHHHFSHYLNTITFKTPGDFDFLHTSSEDIFYKRFFNKDRHGFSIGALVNLTHWASKNLKDNTKKNVTGIYTTLSASYRWFPFQKYVYIEPLFGVSYNFKTNKDIEVGNESFKFVPLELTPEIKIGTRIDLFKKKK